MKRTLIIALLAFLLGPFVAGAQTNPLFAPFQQSMQLAVPLHVAPRQAPTPAEPITPQLPPVQYFLQDGRLIMIVPLANGMYQVFRVD